MSRARKSLGLDRDLMEKLKAVAKGRGMTISGYLRRLISSALELEKMGIHAPTVLEEARILEALKRLGFVVVPRELLESRDSVEDAEAVGRRVAIALQRIGLNPRDLVEYLAKDSGIALLHPNRVVIMKGRGGLNALANFMIGVARASSFRVEDLGDVVVIELS